ncbi:hypothetical protein ILYODFUR_036600 [Ilyodon furcidens]|uniref:Uncharacterized protein n=1 Tax=Ilyodon furcidens TaxID=33524 RepID=A0ABV0UD49_9TELE
MPARQPFFISRFHQHNRATKKSCIPPYTLQKTKKSHIQVQQGVKLKALASIFRAHNIILAYIYVTTNKHLGVTNKQKENKSIMEEKHFHSSFIMANVAFFPPPTQPSYVFYKRSEP